MLKQVLVWILDLAAAVVDSESKGTPIAFVLHCSITHINFDLTCVKVTEGEGGWLVVLIKLV